MNCLGANLTSRAVNHEISVDRDRIEPALVVVFTGGLLAAARVAQRSNRKIRAYPRGAKWGALAKFPIIHA